MLKTLTELNIKPITGKLLSPDIKRFNKEILLYQNTPLAKSKAFELFTFANIIGKTNKMPDIQLVANKLNKYFLEFLWCLDDKDVLQRLINYNVARWIKTKDDNDDETIIQHLQRWKYAKELVNESPFKDEIKLDSFNRLNNEYINILVERYK